MSSSVGAPCPPILPSKYDSLIPHIPSINKECAHTWPALKSWDLGYFSRHISEPLRFRLIEKSFPHIQWENACNYVYATIDEFTAWLNGGMIHSPFEKYSPDLWTAYADYTYIDRHEGLRVLKSDFDWSTCLPDLNPFDGTTFWLASSGAYTPCHYDTYGINLVAQIFGRKRWVLFSPNDSVYLYPTRIPLEESTVYSQINMLSPDFKLHSLFHNATPLETILEPGDCLLIPRHWWHFVQSYGDEPTCSINLWLDQPIYDQEERLGEALTQILAYSLSRSMLDFDFDPLEHLNEKEQDNFLSDDCFPTLLNSTGQIIRSIHMKKTSESESGSAKEYRLSGWQSVGKRAICDVFPSHGVSNTALSETPLTVKLLRAFTHPDVIYAVRKHILG
ncbi:unnamed protein product [Protopolystoma xenopodis]|uniref:JmjC domain-containing protein n=1 Tax=Protopolystoma xenopodis TaxID=117903 RepID=A0A3S5BZ89_9PLAT|nr:unnamed protein product [Protopolystoma xenopodis]